MNAGFAPVSFRFCHRSWYIHSDQIFLRQTQNLRKQFEREDHRKRLIVTKCLVFEAKRDEKQSFTSLRALILRFAWCLAGTLASLVGIRQKRRARRSPNQLMDPLTFQWRIPFIPAGVEAKEEPFHVFNCSVTVEQARSASMDGGKPKSSPGRDHPSPVRG
jgi:hypothetical protein